MVTTGKVLQLNLATNSATVLRRNIGCWSVKFKTRRRQNVYKDPNPQFVLTISTGLIDMTPALHPIPDRLKLMMLLLILNLLTTMALRDGVGQNTLLLVMSMSMAFGFMLFFSNSSVITEHIIVSASSRAKERAFIFGI
ncbi:hypothetical protein CR513_43098, partial [Mucuna pruriens]